MRIIDYILYNIIYIYIGQDYNEGYVCILSDVCTLIFIYTKYSDRLNTHQLGCTFKLKPPQNGWITCLGQVCIIFHVSE